MLSKIQVSGTMRPLKRHRRVAESLSAFTAQQAQRKQLGSLPTRKPSVEYIIVPAKPAKPAKPPQVTSKVEPDRRQDCTAIVDLCSPPATCKRSRESSTPVQTTACALALPVDYNNITTLAEHVCKLRRQAADLTGPLYSGSFCTFDVVCLSDDKSKAFMVLDGTNASVGGVNVELIALVDVNGSRSACSAHNLEKVSVQMFE